MFEYQAYCTRVVDGDTIEVTLDLGFDLQYNAVLRIKHVDTFETYGVPTDTDRYELGVEQTEFVEDWIPERTDDEPWPLVVRTKEKGGFGRWLAEVKRKDEGDLLHEVLLENYDGIEYSE